MNKLPPQITAVSLLKNMTNSAQWSLLAQINAECFPVEEEPEDSPLPQRVVHHRMQRGDYQERQRSVKPLPLPGEISLKEFVSNESRRLRICASAIFMRIGRGKYPNLQIRRATARTVFVKVL